MWCYRFVRSCGVVLLLSIEVFTLDEFPATAHRGYLAPAFNVIVVEYQIYVNYDKEDKEPHGYVVDLSEEEIASNDPWHPGKQVGEPEVTHGCIQTESGKALYAKSDECQEVNKSGERIMPNGHMLLILLQENIDLDHFPHFSEKLLGGRDKILPVCISISNESPVDPENKVEEKDVCSYKVNESCYPKPVAE